LTIEPGIFDVRGDVGLQRMKATIVLSRHLDSISKLIKSPAPRSVPNKAEFLAKFLPGNVAGSETYTSGL
jgi:hypothetical protein